jgi:hypothetical protein
VRAGSSTANRNRERIMGTSLWQGT